MNVRFFILLTVSLLMIGTTAAYSQSAEDDRPLGFGRRQEDLPKNVRETREKMRISQEEKEYNQMMERAEEAVRLSERIARSFGANGRLSDMDLASIESFEKNVKKIRSDLGGDDDEKKVDDVLGEKKLTVGDAVNALKATSATLFAELKKTTRFSVSAASIETSNAAIKIARFLRFGK